MSNLNKTKKNKDRSGNRLRFSVSKGRKQFFLLIFVLLVQIGLLYGLTYWGYHNSRLPGSFDDFVQENGIWRIYGKKVYSVKATQNRHIFNSERKAVDDYIFWAEYDGFLSGYSKDTLTITKMDEPITTFTDFNSIVFFKCTNLSFDELTQYTQPDDQFPVSLQLYIPTECQVINNHSEESILGKRVLVKQQFSTVEDLNKLSILIYE